MCENLTQQQAAKPAGEQVLVIPSLEEEEKNGNISLSPRPWGEAGLFQICTPDFPSCTMPVPVLSGVH